MISTQRSIAMLFAGTAAGILSGLIFFWLRAGLFGFCLTLTVVFVRRAGWRWFAFLPGIALGIGLGFFPVQFPEFGIGRESVPPSYDFVTALNCALFMPIYVYAYLRPKYWSRIWRLFAAGYLSTLFRSVSLSPLHWTWHIWDSYLFGILPFFVLWLLLLWTIDPHFIIKKADAGDTR